MSNLVSAIFTEEQQREALDLIAQLKTKFPFAINLTANERNHVKGIQEGRIPFVENALLVGLEHPEIAPSYTDLKEFKLDVDFVKTIRPVIAELSSLAQMMNDTYAVAGNEAYNAALSIYQSGKGAAKAGVPGMKSFVEDLSKQFDGQGKPGSQTGTK